MRYIKQFNENFDVDLTKGGSYKTLKDVKDIKNKEFKYTVKSIKNYLKDRKNRWNEEYMPFPKKYMILNILIGSNIGKYHFIQCQEKRGNLDQWNWVSKICKNDIDSLPIPDEIFDKILNDI